MTQLVDDTSDSGMLIDETDKFESPIFLVPTLIIDAPSYTLEDDLTKTWE